MRAFSKLSFCLISCLLVTITAWGAESTPESQRVAHQSNLIVGSLMALVAVKFSIAGTLGYLWYRKSKYKKQKVILDI